MIMKSLASEMCFHTPFEDSMHPHGMFYNSAGLLRTSVRRLDSTKVLCSYHSICFEKLEAPFILHEMTPPLFSKKMALYYTER